MANTTPPKLKFAFDGSTVNTKDGVYVPPVLNNGTLDYSTSNCANNDSAYVASLMAESLNIAAGPVNIFPLLGVYSQGATVDATGAGFPLSSGTPAGFNVLNAFNINNKSWRSISQGADVLTATYIGYDFGTKKAWQSAGVSGQGAERYFPSQPVRMQISTIQIQQGSDSNNRATQARIEASDDGVKWNRIAIVTIPDSEELVSVSFNSHAPYNKWKIIPTFFNGVASNSQWEVIRIQMLESSQVALDNIQDFIFLENRDRAYDQTSTMIKCQYDLLDVQTELAKFGINLPETYIFVCSFITMVTQLGRPVIVGDIIELPGEIQYDTNLRVVRKWLEVTDTSWSTEGYTMNWKPNLFRFYAQPVLPSVEHQDILGIPGQVNTLQTDDSLLNGVLLNEISYKSNEAIKQIGLDMVPQAGSDPQDIQSGKPLIGKNGGYDGGDMYSGDAIPPNGADYTFGDTLPDPSTISDGHYHRQTYTGVSKEIRPPDRLLRYNSSIGRWKVVEINRRGVYESNKKTIARLIDSPNQFQPDQKP